MKVTPAQHASLLTEQRNPDTMKIDRLSTREILETIHREDYKAFHAIDSQMENIEHIVEFVVKAFRSGGRLIYIGAGTSGRLGVLDAAECPPTYGTNPDMVQGIIAGGWEALRRSIERAEDSAENGADEIAQKDVCNRDVVIGIAASSTTPFVIGGLVEAHRRGAKTVFLTCNPRSYILSEIDITINLLVGPEVVTGSTRMKAGTATKLVLNMITTTAMIRMGKVYQNLMVDLNATCNKLENRSRRILHLLAGLSESEADELLQRANGRVKTALVMHLRGISYEEAEILIAESEGLIHPILEDFAP